MMKLVLYLIIICGACIKVEAFCQDTIQSPVSFGMRYSFVYNYKIFHHAPNFSVFVRRHNMYAGIQYTQIIKPLDDPADRFEKKSYGINIGYRYALVPRQKKIAPFVQCNYSIYHITYFEHQLGPPFSTKRKRLILENTLSVGVDYNPFRHVHLFLGLGFGSFDGFFLLVESFTPHSYIGLEYEF